MQKWGWREFDVLKIDYKLENLELIVISIAVESNNELLGHLLMIERSIATVFVERYEKRRDSIGTMISVLLTVGLFTEF